MNFRLEQRVKVISTGDMVDSVLDILQTEGYKKPLCVIDGFFLEHKKVKTLLEKIKSKVLDYVVYSEIKSDPSIESVDKGAQIYKENQCDSIISLGGGSVIDASRGINIVQNGGGSSRDYVFDKEVEDFIGGQIAIPTTSGTGSELSNAVVITDTTNNEKLTILANNAVSEYAVLDPELTLSVPTQMTIATGLDAFGHALEGYTSKLSTPITDALCEKIMFLIVNYLPKAVRNGEDKEARMEMMVAASLAGWLLNNAGTQLGHSQAHILGAKYKMPHGAAVAYATPGMIQYTSPHLPKKIREVGNIMGAEFPPNATDFEIGTIVADKYKEFRDEVLGLRPFSEYGIDQADVIANAEAVANERFAGNAPMDVDAKLAEKILSMFGEV